MDTNTEAATPQETAQALIETAVAVASEAEAPPSEIDLIEARTDAEVALIEARAEADARVEAARAEGIAMVEMARAGNTELEGRLTACEARITALETAQTQSPAPAVAVVTSTPPISEPSPSESATPPAAEPVTEADPSAVAEAGQRESPEAPPPPARKRFQRM